MNLADYVQDALRRLQAGEVIGSHATGVYNKAANAYEKLFRTYFEHLAQKTPAQRTLGQLIHELERLPAPAPPDLAEILDDAKVVNKPWTQVKHGSEPSVNDLVLGLHAIQRTSSSCKRGVNAYSSRGTFAAKKTTALPFARRSVARALRMLSDLRTLAARMLVFVVSSNAVPLDHRRIVPLKCPAIVGLHRR